uniref:Uncharacterized protein n=1 Tax=Ditylenchus dipsaci TaxID=166011 RepID=A0A915DQT8_9BILA
MDSMLSKLNFAIAYMDDIIVVSNQNGKVLVLQNSIKYPGQIIDKDGRRPDPAKIEAVVNMPPPTDVPTLRSYLGMVNFYQPYVSDLVNIRKPLDLLLLQDKLWKWDDEVIVGSLQLFEEAAEAQLQETVRYLPLKFQDLVSATNLDAALLQVKNFVATDWVSLISHVTKNT